MLTPVAVNRENVRGEGAKGTFYQGDVLHMLADLKGKYTNSIKLIYLDPPFLTGDRFEMRVRVGEKEWKTSRGTLALDAFYDEKDVSSYMNMMRRVLMAAREMLTDDGMLFLHIDYRAHARLRLLADELFGEDNFLNEIIWTYQTGGRARRFFSRKHDIILFYRKGKNYDFNMEAVLQPRSEPRDNHMRKHVDPDGRVYRSIRSAGRVYTYYDDDPVAPGDVWDDVSHLQQKDPQRTGYDTQKPLKLLERIVRCASREGETVMDMFAGSSTTLEAAVLNGRNFVGVDKCPLSLSIARRRLEGASTEFMLKNTISEATCDACISRGVGFYRVELKSFDAVNPSERIFEDMDMVDSWAVGYISGDCFEPTAQFMRRHKQPKLINVLEVPVYEGTVGVRVSDVFGRNHYFAWDEAKTK